MGSDTQHSTIGSNTKSGAPAEATMQAIEQDTYGSAEVLRLARIPRPEIGGDNVLVRVRAASVHIGDWHVMTGLPYLLRVVGFGFRAPKARIRGTDVAGTVEAVGQNVTRFQVGDEVFGTCDGSFAEYAATAEDTLVLKPANLTFEQAAAVPTSSIAALQALRGGGIKSGQQVLLVGASGGVGLFAVQIAKSFGADVTAVCSTTKVDLVRSVGADHVIDYTREDFIQSGQQYDLILIMGGNHSLSQLKRVLRAGGTLVPVGTEAGNRWVGGKAWIRAMLLSRLVRHLRPLTSEPSQADLQFLTELIAAGKITPVIDKTYPLSEVPDAIRYLTAGQALGKIVITV
ncbi:MAG TPA: NAD(P)-dependent alcohol dehydrogenase [Propionibacteriaceae bacterium]|nr:NAD(P)-dependent alcohol dehydrogenase [Propionibacteriaceae bacterium]